MLQGVGTAAQEAPGCVSFLPELLHLSHLTLPMLRCPCRACPPPVPWLQPRAPCPAHLSPVGPAPDPSWKVSSVFAFGFGFSVCQKPSCQMCKTGGILHLMEFAQFIYPIF